MTADLANDENTKRHIAVRVGKAADALAAEDMTQSRRGWWAR